MDYPSLCLNQDLIDKVFLETKQVTPRHQYVNPKALWSKKNYHQYVKSKASWSKENYRQKKELRSQSGEVEECDQCDYKTTKYMAMYVHKRVQHIGVKKKCTECDYSHVYPAKL